MSSLGEYFSFSTKNVKISLPGIILFNVFSLLSTLLNLH